MEKYSYLIDFLVYPCIHSELRGGNQAISDFRVCDNGERTAQPPEAQNTQVWYHNKGMVILF